MLAGDPEIFLTSKLTAGERRVLFTKWVGKAWQETSRRIKDTVIRSFVKCGIALPTSGERDNEINIEGIPEYTIAPSYDVEHVMFYDSSDDISTWMSAAMVATYKGEQVVNIAKCTP